MSGAMDGVAEDIPDRGNMNLATIKKDIEISRKYFADNEKRYRDFYIMVFKTALSDADRDNLALIGKPAIEFPILEAYISRLRGEFSKQQPQIDVHAAEGLAVGHVDDEYLKLLKVIQAHLNEIFFEADNDEFSYDIYSDTLAGGYSVAKVYSDYVNEKSFQQKICIERVRNPTMCGFDPLAVKSHKGDGRYCFELSPMSQEEFAEEFGYDKAKNFNFTRSLDGFNWTYKNQDTKVVLIADYYVKVERKTTMFRIAENDLDIPTSMTQREYNRLVRTWDKIEQIPVVLEKRTSIETQIDRYRICQNEVLDHVETSYTMLPLVFIDGNSVMVQNTQGGQIEQMTRPFVYHAEGAQRLMNFAGQTVGQELEDMPRNTYMVPVAGIPEAYVKQYQNPQIAGTLAYHQYDPKTGKDLNPPQVVQRQPTPPLVQETFAGSQNITQQILGAYDSVLGTNDKQISGVAIQQGAMQSNAAAIPYLVGFIKGLQRCAEIIIHLMPLFYTTPRSIPIRLANGKRDYQIINAPYPKVDKQKQMVQKAQQMGMGGGQEIENEEEEESNSDEYENAIMFNYDPHDINVKIEAGVNAAIEKQVSMEQLTNLMGVSESFKAFMEQKGLPVLIENMDIRGIEALKEQAEEFQAMMAQQQQQQAGQPTDTDKVVMAEIKKSELEAHAREQKTIADTAVSVAKIAIAREETELKRQELELKAHEAHTKLHMERENQAAQATASTIELAVDVMKHQSEQQMQQQQMEQQQAPQ